MLSDFWPSLDLVGLHRREVVLHGHAFRLRAARRRLVREDRHQVHHFLRALPALLRCGGAAGRRIEGRVGDLLAAHASASRSSRANASCRPSTPAAGARWTGRNCTRPIPTTAPTGRRTRARSRRTSSTRAPAWAACRSPIWRRTASHKYVSTGDNTLPTATFNPGLEGRGRAEHAHAVHRAQVALAHLHGPHAVLHRPPVVHRGARSAAHAQAEPEGRRRLIPFQMVSCHARWSIHSQWRDNPMMLRLQRGEPCMLHQPARCGGARRRPTATSPSSTTTTAACFMRVKH